MPVPNLSNLGLSAPSQSSAADEGGPTLSDLLGNVVLDEAGKSRILEDEINQLRQGKDSSFLQNLLSPSVLATLGLAGGAAIFGGETGRGIGAGLGIGALSGADLLGEIDRSQRTAAIDELEDKLEDSQGRLDKARNRFSNLMTSNPELFVSPEGEVPDAQVLGWLTTGTDIPLYPQTRRIENRRDERWKARFDIFSKGLENAKSKSDANNLTRAMFQHLGWKDVPSEIVENLSNSFGTPEFERELASTLLRHGGPTALDAMIFAGENGLPLHHPDVLRKVQFVGDPSSAITPSQRINQKFLRLIDEVNDWQGDPLNSQSVLQIQQEAKGDQTAASRAIIERALEGRNADIAFMADKANLPADTDLATLMAAFRMVSGKEGMLDLLSAAGAIKEFADETPEERRDRRGSSALQLIESTEGIAAEKQGNRDAELRNKAAMRFQTGFQEVDATFGVSQIYQLVDMVYVQALKDAERNPDGTINRESFEKLFNQYTQEALEQNLP